MVQFNWSDQIQNWVFKTWLDNKGSNVKVAVLDTGVDLSHPSLSALDVPGHKINVTEPGFNLSRLHEFCDCDVTDRHQEKGHGTQGISILSAAEEGENLLAGLIPKAEFFIIKVNTSDNRFFLVKDFLKGLEAAAVLKVDLVISSISFPSEDVESENISQEEIDRVFGLMEKSKTLFFTALPNTTPLKSWVGLSDANFPSNRPESINVGVISEQIFNKRKKEIAEQPAVHFLVSDSTGVFCKINKAYTEEPVTSSFAVYIIGGIAALYLASIKKREREDYSPRSKADILKGLSQQFQQLAALNTWRPAETLLLKTDVIDSLS